MRILTELVTTMVSPIRWGLLCLIASVAAAEVPSYLSLESLTRYPYTESCSIEAIFRYKTPEDPGFTEYYVTQYLSREHSSARMDITAATGSDKFQIYYSMDSPKRYLVRDGSISELIWPDIKRSQRSVIGMANEVQDFLLLLGPEMSSSTRIYRDARPLDKGFSTLAGLNFSLSTLSVRGGFTVYFCVSVGSGNVFDPDQVTIPNFITFEGSMYSRSAKYLVQYEILNIKTYSFPDLLKVPTILPPGQGDKSMFLKKALWPRILKRQRVIVVSSDVLEKRRKKTELFYDSSLNYSRIESLEDETATVFDMNLGVKYDFTDALGRSTCTINTLDLRNHLLLRVFTRVSSSDTYLGSVYCRNRLDKICNVFEQYFYDYIFEDVKYDLFIIVFYLTDLDRKSSASPLAGVDFFGYKKKREGKYELILQLQNDIYSDALSTSGREIYETKFNVKHCFPDPSQRMLIVAEYSHKGNNTTEFAGKDYSDYYKGLVLKAFRSEPIFSLTRVADLDIDWFDDQFVVNLLAVEAPQIDKSFIVTNISVDSKKFPSALSYGKVEDCMKASTYSDHKGFVACQEPRVVICLTLKGDVDLSDLEGPRQCQLYVNAATPPSRLTKELDLFANDRVTDSFLRRVLTRTFEPGFALTRLFLRDYLKNDEKEEIFINRRIYRIISPRDYLVKTAKTFSECKQACESHKYLDCTGFSFCEPTNNSPGQCVVSSSRRFETTLTEVKDAACSAVGRSSLDFYEKTLSGKYMIKNSYDQVSGSLQICAKECAHDNRCKGFLAKLDQNGVPRCFFSDQLNPELTRHLTDASYYSVKPGYIFDNPSENLATEVFATYSNVSFKRCADLCYKSKYTECVSFNYCQTTDCQLSGKRISEQGTTKKAECSSYEREGMVRNQRFASRRKVESISVHAGFWIVTALCIGGLLLGAGLMFLYSMSSLSSAGQMFSLASSGWRRHQDEQL